MDLTEIQRFAFARWRARPVMYYIIWTLRFSLTPLHTSLTPLFFVDVSEIPDKFRNGVPQPAKHNTEL